MASCVLNKKTVSLIGISSLFGRLTSLLLKQSDAIKYLYLYDEVDITTACDVAQINTSCKVRAFQGVAQLSCAVKNSDVIIIGDQTNFYCNVPKVLLDEGAPRIVEIGRILAESCSQAMILVATNPVNTLLPLLSNVLAYHNVYDCNKVLGVTTVDNIRANAILARHLKLDPKKVVLPVLGGNSVETRVPIFSQARPNVNLSKKVIKKLNKEIKYADNIIYKNKKELEAVNKAYATTKFVHSVLAGLRGEPNIAEIALNRTAFMPGTTFFALPFILGPLGIEYRFPLSPLSQFEEHNLSHAVANIHRDIENSKEYFDPRVVSKVNSLLENKEKGLITEGLLSHFRSNKSSNGKISLEFALMEKKQDIRLLPATQSSNLPVPAEPAEPFDHCYEGCNPLDLPLLPTERRTCTPVTNTGTCCKEEECPKIKGCGPPGNCPSKICNHGFKSDAPPHFRGEESNPPCCSGLTTPYPQDCPKVTEPEKLFEYTTVDTCPKLQEKPCNKTGKASDVETCSGKKTDCGTGPEVENACRGKVEDTLNKVQFVPLTEHSQIDDEKKKSSGKGKESKGGGSSSSSSSGGGSSSSSSSSSCGSAGKKECHSEKLDEVSEEVPRGCQGSYQPSMPENSCQNDENKVKIRNFSLFDQGISNSPIKNIFTKEETSIADIVKPELVTKHKTETTKKEVIIANINNSELVPKNETEVTALTIKPTNDPKKVFDIVAVPTKTSQPKEENWESEKKTTAKKRTALINFKNICSKLFSEYKEDSKPELKETKNNERTDHVLEAISTFKLKDESVNAHASIGKDQKHGLPEVVEVSSKASAHESQPLTEVLSSDELKDRIKVFQKERKTFKENPNNIRTSVKKKLYSNQLGNQVLSDHNVNFEPIRSNQFFINDQANYNKSKNSSDVYASSQIYAPQCPPEYLYGEYIQYKEKGDSVTYGNVKEHSLKKKLAEQVNLKEVSKDTKRINENPKVMDQIIESNVATKQVQEIPVVTRQINESPAITKQINESSAVTKQINESSAVTKQINESPAGFKQMKESPAGFKHMNESPVATKQINESPAVFKQINESPAVFKQLHESPVVTKKLIETPMVTKQINESPIIGKQVKDIPIFTNQINKSSIVTKTVKEIPTVTQPIKEKPLFTKQIEESPSEGVRKVLQQINNGPMNLSKRIKQKLWFKYEFPLMGKLYKTDQVMTKAEPSNESLEQHNINKVDYLNKIVPPPIDEKININEKTNPLLSLQKDHKSPKRGEVIRQEVEEKLRGLKVNVSEVHKPYDEKVKDFITNRRSILPLTSPSNGDPKYPATAVDYYTNRKKMISSLRTESDRLNRDPNRRVRY